MHRRPSTQDLTWLLDLANNGQLDLDPPYQRRSVWTRKDKQFFLDTIFRNFPSPAIFLHKSLDDAGKATYHVVDGKQRLTTILEFLDDRVRISSDFGDVRLDGMKWSDLKGEQDLRQRLWNYQITVEMIDVVDGAVVNEIFDRLNRNARKLTRQELRHAKFEGWLISEAEAESAREEWRELGVATTARAKRMVDNQFISELMLVVLEGQIFGFDQASLDDFYAKYEDPSDTAPDLDQDEFRAKFSRVRTYLVEINGHDGVVAARAKGFGNFYTLWAVAALGDNLPDAAVAAERYEEFMAKVAELSEQQDLDAFLRGKPEGEYAVALRYFRNSRGASTDSGPRMERFEALQTALSLPEP